MARSVEAFYYADVKAAVEVIVSTAATMGFTVKSANVKTGQVTFDAGPKWNASGQSVSVYVTEAEPRLVRLCISSGSSTAAAFLDRGLNPRHVFHKLVAEMGKILPMDETRTRSANGPEWLSKLLAAFHHQ